MIFGFLLLLLLKKAFQQSFYDLQDQVKKVEGLEAIKAHAEKMASEGADAFTVRGFINEGAKKLAFEHPDEEAFRKAARAAARQVRKNK